MNASSLFDLALWVAGVGHFGILLASFQVPARLKWKEDLAHLMPFNRKLLWVQSGFTAGTIIAFGVLTLTLHQEMMRGDRAALALVLFIGLYWTARLAVDAVYYAREDWPKGRTFAIGHIILNVAFVCLAATYLGLFAWKTWG
ncbi:MAG: hypothetical protein HYX28_04050 [Candidatus Koribacter versatilis]|uniref:Uncharacterized protein n=1 Tax=Candidatus Korobacter versatilis TaxID=658062 RepID=A0A932A748_9BACT|nr:hypothetical protein [Candidatus Koribacter versatilis]